MLPDVRRRQFRWARLALMKLEQDQVRPQQEPMRVMEPEQDLVMLEQPQELEGMTDVTRTGLGVTITLTTGTEEVSTTPEAGWNASTTSGTWTGQEADRRQHIQAAGFLELAAVQEVLAVARAAGTEALVAAGIMEPAAEQVEGVAEAETEAVVQVTGVLEPLAAESEEEVSEGESEADAEGVASGTGTGTGTEAKAVATASAAGWRWEPPQIFGIGASCPSSSSRRSPILQTFT